MKLRSLILVLSLLLAPRAWADDFGFHAGSHFGFGRMGEGSGRGTGVLDFQFMPGYRLPLDILGGLLIEYRFMSQLDGTSETTDYSGNGFQLGAGLMYEPGPIKLLASYDFRTRHSCENTHTIYKGSGYHFLAGYKLIPSLSFDVEYVITNYNTVERFGQESRTPPGTKHTNVGFGISYSY